MTGQAAVTPERIARLRRVLDRRQPDLTVVTDLVHKPRNLSAILRNCDAVGVMRVHAVLGKAEYRAFRGTAMGSHQWVDVRRESSIETALAPLRESGYQVVAAHLDAGAVDYREVDYCGPTAVLMGAERRGVSAPALALADHRISIPMVGMVASYNVSVAAGIILAEAMGQRQRAGHYSRLRLDPATYQRLLFEWGHPAVKDFCRREGLRYPALDADGEIENPAHWYALVRAGGAPRIAGEARGSRGDPAGTGAGGAPRFAGEARGESESDA